MKLRTIILSSLLALSVSQTIKAEDLPTFQETCFIGKQEIQGSFQVWPVYSTEKEDIYSAHLLDDTNMTLGSCKINYNKETKTAYCYDLWINQTSREAGIGSCLCAYVAKFIASFDANTIEWHVKPFDLRDNETEETMHPKLMRFYESLGGTFDAQRKVMVVNLKPETPVQDSNALKRAQMIMGHLAPAELSAQPTQGTNESEKIVKKEKIYSNQTKKMIGSIEILQIEKGIYNARLLDSSHREIGDASFTYNEEKREANIELVDIISSMRNKGYGKLFLAQIGKYLIELGCTNVTGIASPFDPSDDKTQAQMLPHLVNFYQQFGATIEQENQTNAIMQINDNQESRDKLEKILNDF